MSSAKNTVVAILLLGVSYGVYQVINAPEGPDPLAGLVQIGTGNPVTGDASGAKGEAAADDWNAASPPAPLPALPSPAGSTAGLAGSGGLNVPPLQPSASGGQQGLSPFSSPGSLNEPLPPANGLTPVPPSGAAFPAVGGNANNQGLPGSPGGLQSPPSAPGDTVKLSPQLGDQFTGTRPPVPLVSIWSEVQKLTDEGKFAEALNRLSPYHRQVPPTDPERSRLNDWLDALAAKVIYSSEHHFRPEPYEVRAGDTLEALSGAWNIPQQLIYNVNRDQLPDPMALQPGTKLKYLKGPFRGELDSSRSELTLYADGMYAGRFPLAGAVSLTPGTYRVLNKVATGHACGDFCLVLDPAGMATISAAGGSAPSQAAATFAATDAEDLFGILSIQSEIVVR